VRRPSLLALLGFAATDFSIWGDLEVRDFGRLSLKPSGVSAANYDQLTTDADQRTGSNEIWLPTANQPTRAVARTGKDF
jgi:hypothetical protein